MFTMNRSRLARNAAADTTSTVVAERVGYCVVAAKFASRLSSPTGRQGHGARTIAGYSKLYLAGPRWDTAAGVEYVTLPHPAVGLGSGDDHHLQRGAS